MVLRILMAVSLLLSSASFGFSDTEFTRSFMPENDLHLEDNFMATSNVTEEMFNLIIDTAKELYQPMADAKDENLVINNKWSDSTVNANCSRWWGTVTINMYGGLARRPEVSPEAFALVLCHELGHAYGGYPYINKSSEMSAEGQADYYGSKDCLKTIIQELEDAFLDYEPTSYMTKVCEGDYVCLRGLNAGQGLGDLLSSLKNDKVAPDYETPDPLVVKKTQLSYPQTVQCRLDTYLAGALDRDRPQCWFKK
jgi:hypothetical protein